jgi:hypothetical protein
VFLCVCVREACLRKGPTAALYSFPCISEFLSSPSRKSGSEMLLSQLLVLPITHRDSVSFRSFSHSQQSLPGSNAGTALPLLNKLVSHEVWRHPK